MADNSTLPATGDIIAADDIGGLVKVQRVKVGWGPDGTLNDADVATGKPLPIQLRSATGTAATVLPATTSPVASDPALVVALSPNSSGLTTLGQALMASSAPVAIASDQTPVPIAYADTSKIVSGCISTAMSTTTPVSLVAAPGASLRNYITTFIVSNSHATVGTDIAIQDGSGGTTLMIIPAAAVYGGATITLPTPLRQPTTNTALFAANVTTGASTKVTAVGFKAA